MVTLKKFLHKIKNFKIILLSGTPMVNNIKEMIDVMNLILPENNQINTERGLKTEEDINYFKGFFKGRVSYLKS